MLNSLSYNGMKIAFVPGIENGFRRPPLKTALMLA